MKFASYVALLAVCSCCPQRQVTEPQEPSPSAQVAVEPNQAPQVDAPSEEVVETNPVWKGLAAQVCSGSDFPPPVAGEVRASLIPNTQPTALDPKDDEFHLYEGPVWLDGVLYFSDFRTTPGFPSRILRYSPAPTASAEQGLSVALEDSGTNGLALDAMGSHLMGARHSSKSVVRFATGPELPRDVAAVYEGKPFNSPNDLVSRSDGNVYFTDPDFQAGSTRSQATTNVYRIDPTGQVSVIDSSIANPNGIALSLDESTLFVAGNLEAGYLKRYPIAANGAVGEGEIVLQPVVVPDGLVLDCAGNIYVTEHTSKRVRVLSSEGEELGRITGMDHNVTNVAFGGRDRKTLYITTTGALYELELPVPGLPY